MNNDIIFFASAIGVFYSLMAGLMAVAVWGNYAAVQDLVSQEASSIGALYRDVTSLPEPARRNCSSNCGSTTPSSSGRLAGPAPRAWCSTRRRAR